MTNLTACHNVILTPAIRVILKRSLVRRIISESCFWIPSVPIVILPPNSQAPTDFLSFQIVTTVCWLTDGSKALCNKSLACTRESDKLHIANKTSKDFLNMMAKRTWNLFFQEFPPKIVTNINLDSLQKIFCFFHIRFSITCFFILNILNIFDIAHILSFQ